MLAVYGATHAGRLRTMNEDTFFCDPALGLFAVADGMGGHNAGEIASALAIEALQSFVSSARESENVTWPYGFDPRMSYAANCLTTSVRLASRRVFLAAASRREYSGMGTTLTAALVSGSSLTYANVGDSRLYSFRDDRLELLTVDDSWVATLLAETPAMDPGALAAHPMRNVLTKVVGVEEDVRVSAHERRLSDGETLLLCTDGLHGLVDAGAIRQILTEHPAADAVHHLVDRALEHGGTDNITAVVLRYSAAEPDAAGAQP